MLITLGVWVGLARAHLRAVNTSLATLGDSQTAMAKILAEVVRVLESLDHTHTPERADGAGFGTEWLRAPMAEVTRTNDILLTFAREHRQENARDHASIMQALASMGKDIPIHSDG